MKSHHMSEAPCRPVLTACVIWPSKPSADDPCPAFTALGIRVGWWRDWRRPYFEMDLFGFTLKGGWLG